MGGLRGTYGGPPTQSDYDREEAESRGDYSRITDNPVSWWDSVEVILMIIAAVFMVIFGPFLEFVWDVLCMIVSPFRKKKINKN